MHSLVCLLFVTLLLGACLCFLISLVGQSLITGIIGAFLPPSQAHDEQDRVEDDENEETGY